MVTSFADVVCRANVRVKKTNRFDSNRGTEETKAGSLRAKCAKSFNATDMGAESKKKGNVKLTAKSLQRRDGSLSKRVKRSNGLSW